MNRIVLSVVVISMVIGSSFLSSEDSESNDKRSAIVEADGYAFLAEEKTIREIREEAIANAKRNAMERAETYIKSFTAVENFQMTYDLIQTGAEGYVRVLETKDHGITTDNRYRYWIKAEVEYDLRLPKIEAVENIMVEKMAPLTIKVWTEKKEFQDGEKIKIFFRGNKDFYARIVYETAGGELIQILPNQHRTNNLFTAGKVWQVPDENDRFELVVDPPFGNEQIIIFASSADMGRASVESFGTDLYTIQGTLEEYASRTRGLKIQEQPNGSGGAEFYEATCQIRTLKK
jgi:hypothetical protein